MLGKSLDMTQELFSLIFLMEVPWAILDFPQGLSEASQEGKDGNQTFLSV